MSTPPARAFKPGTRLTVGSHKIEVQKYLSQGKFQVIISNMFTNIQVGLPMSI